MPEVRVEDEQGTVHVFPDGSTPDMIAQVMKVKPPSAPAAAAPPKPRTLADMLSLPAHGAGSLGPGQPEATPGMWKAGVTGLSTVPAVLSGGASVPVQSAVLGLTGAAESKLEGGSNTEAAVSGAVGAVLPGVGAALSKVSRPAVGKVASFLSDVINPEYTGMLSPRLAHAQRVLGKIGAALAKAEPEATGVALGPESPSKELLQSRALATGAQQVTDPAAGLGRIPIAAGKAIAPAATSAAEKDLPAALRPITDPSQRLVHGESALRQILTGQDNVNLLKIAKARGINVAKESLLKAGVADKLLVNKIVDDFSSEELADVSSQFIENNRFRHDFGDIGPEAWKTLSMQSYFPEMKIPAAALKRTAAALQTAVAQGTTEDDLLPALRESLKRAKDKTLVPSQ